MTSRPDHFIAGLLWTLFGSQVLAQTPQWAGPPSSFTRMRFARDYPTGSHDTNGGFLGGTSCMYLVAHDGKLWAGIGYWNDVPGSDPTPGPQIVVKESAAAAWKVDTSFGTDFLRVDAFYAITLTTDKNGAALNPPIKRLLASCTDITPSYEAHVWMRDPASLPGTGIGHMGIRTSAPSPFDGEAGRVFYFGGGDAGGSTPWLHNTAWVCRGTLPDDTTPFSISGTTATLTLETTAGWNAQIQTSTNLSNWNNPGSAIVGNNAPRTVNQNISGQTRRFYRVQHTRNTP